MHSNNDAMSQVVCHVRCYQGDWKKKKHPILVHFIIVTIALPYIMYHRVVGECRKAINKFYK